MTGKAEAPASELPEWLIGKDAICSVLKQDNDRWRAILRLAKQADPPPIVTQRGGQSRAERTTLCRWWEGVMARRDASSTRNAERRLAGEARHPYGRGGEAAPEVAGGVHRRRAAKGRKT